MILLHPIWQLLGKDSHDIDIALDNMLGKQFCEKVNEYLKSIGEETSGVGVIQRYASGSSLHVIEFPLSLMNSTLLTDTKIFYEMCLVCFHRLFFC